MMLRPGARRPSLMLRRVLLGLALAGLAVAASGAQPAWADGSPSGNVKYYQVRPAQDGSPESLSDIAQRLLGSAARADEIYSLNAGRVQFDGGRLTDRAVLHVGWLLILPWDAVGDGVILGPLPSRPTTPAPAATKQPAPATKSPGPSTTPAAGADASSSCAAVPVGATGNIPWPQLRLAPDQAWTTTRGSGVTVAVIDTGVDGSVPALAGRVRAAVTIGANPHRAAAGCADHGTAMAGIIVAQSQPGSGLVGMAPDARILPVNVDVVAGVIPPAQTVAALQAAVSASVGVAMIAIPTDLTDPAVVAAVGNAVSHNVVVVVQAGLPGGTTRDGVLRVGAVKADDSLARQYPAGAVDVLAPGDAVVTVGSGGTAQVEGSGTDYAVAFVAGLAALVRSASPTVSASDATRRIESTADRNPGVTAADAQYGYGVIDPAAAVLSVPAPVGVGPSASGSDLRILLPIVLAALLAVWFARTRVRRARIDWTEPSVEHEPVGIP